MDGWSSPFRSSSLSSHSLSAHDTCQWHDTSLRRLCRPIGPLKTMAITWINLITLKLYIYITIIYFTIYIYMYVYAHECIVAFCASMPNYRLLFNLLFIHVRFSYMANDLWSFELAIVFSLNKLIAQSEQWQCGPLVFDRNICRPTTRNGPLLPLFIHLSLPFSSVSSIVF